MTNFSIKVLPRFRFFENCFGNRQKRKCAKSMQKYVCYAGRLKSTRRTREKQSNLWHKGGFPGRKMARVPRGGRKRVTEGRESKRGEVWTSNGTGGMTNQLLVVQLGPHTQHRYYRDHYLSPATPLPRRKGEGTAESHDARLQIRPPVTAQPLFSMEINRAICLSTVPKSLPTIENMHVASASRKCVRRVRTIEIFFPIFLGGISSDISFDVNSSPFQR